MLILTTSKELAACRFYHSLFASIKGALASTTFISFIIYGA